VQLLADRFVIDSGGRATDLATGASVVIRIAPAQEASEQLRWTVRCDFFRALQHRVIAPLLDCGLLGDASRFEAWRCGTSWRSTHAARASIADRATRFLSANRLTVGGALAEGVYAASEGPVVVPDDGTGYPDGSERLIPDVGAEYGLRHIHRTALDSLRELFDHDLEGRPRMVVLWGPPGSGRKTMVQELARVARINGFVPVTREAIDSAHAELWRGRSLFIIGRGTDDSTLSAAVRLTSLSPRPHVVVFISDREHHAIPGVRLEPIDPATLVSAVLPHVDRPLEQRRIGRAARRARGWPGRFVRLLRGSADHVLWSARSRVAMRGLRAAEQPAVYGEPMPVQGARRRATMSAAWPAARELANLRERMVTATTLIARGRHAPGLRQLRSAIAALGRRGDWNSATDGSLMLAGTLLQRGRPKDAIATLGEAQRYADRAGRETAVIDAAILMGDAWIDLGRLDEAEAVLASASTTARGLQHASGVASASIALGRCLYWRGDYDDAELSISTAQEASLSREGLRRNLLAVRVAIARGRVGDATAMARQANAAAEESNDLRARAAARFCQALLRFRIGDVDAAERDLAQTIDIARSAHDPLRIIRARLLQVEVARHRGHHGAAAAQLERLGRLLPSLPPIVRARSQLLAALLSEAHTPMDIISRHVKTSGLGALAIYAGANGSNDRHVEAFESIAAEVIAIVRACQTAADEALVLKEVCARLRRQLHAVAVAFVSGPSRRYATLAFDGPRVDPAIAERAVTAGVTIGPTCHDNRVEAAVPVHYGGAPIGVLCARWVLGSTHDLRRVSTVLEMAAAAAAPVVAALNARADVVVPAGAALLGVTPAMMQLRQSVERAATAPFPVLVTGESGSGKELVARAIHRRGQRRDRTFCTLNCAALPDDLVEAELFGHARGSFTGAIAERAGVFEEAHGGTLFLDEIGELSPRAQAKVLRVIQEGELRRVGENLPRRVDVRIVAATNRDLGDEVAAGRFRSDLLYRLDVIRVNVPPLRERREDIAVLAEHFWREAAGRIGSRATLGAATIVALARYDWPGNVRELQNVLASLAVRSPRRGVVPADALPTHIAASNGGPPVGFLDARRTFEESFVRAALARAGGHRAQAAADLGLSRQGLTKLMSRLGIASNEDAAANDDE
jgi:DNA-binding NtrC family response regulator/tetratricopeptide (TPR) repeat protein